jgi:hypothetical protein
VIAITAAVAVMTDVTDAAGASTKRQSVSGE